MPRMTRRRVEVIGSPVRFGKDCEDCEGERKTDLVRIGPMSENVALQIAGK